MLKNVFKDNQSGASSKLINVFHNTSDSKHLFFSNSKQLL